MHESKVVQELTTENKPMSLSEHKKAMAAFWTVRLPRVEKCGHRFHNTQEPKNNCPWCWFAFFQVNGEITQIAEECFQKDGKEMLIKVKGEKFAKNFLRFMGTLAYMQENNVNGFGQREDQDIRGGREGTQ